MGNKGTYIYLDRGILDHWTYTDKPFNRSMAWIDLLLIANHKTHTTMWKGKTIQFKRGDVNLSITELSKRWGWSRGKTRRFILSLEMDGMVNIRRTSDGTVLTIVKYGTFQDKRTPKRTPNGTTHDTPHGTSVGTQTINDKEMQKEIKEKEQPPTSQEVVAAEEEEERIEVIPGYTQKELDESFIDGFIPMTQEEWEALPEG